MKNDSIKEAIQKAFRDTMISLAALTFNGQAIAPVVEYDNQVVAPPDRSADPANTVFVRFTIKMGSTSQKTFGTTGSRTFRKMGIAIAQVRTPGGIGTGLTDFVVAKIETDFAGVTRYGVVFHAADPQPGRVDRENWLENVNLPFFADRIA